MPARKKLLCLGLILFSSLSGLSALEVVRDDLKLALHEGMGRFSLYARRDPGSPFVPLFVAQDPRSTVMSVIVGDKLYKIGDSGAFKETAQATPEGARFLWVSEKLEISEDFIFVPRGVAVRITLSNHSGSELLVGLRLCIDTYLGEKGSAHFSTSADPKVSRETDISRDRMISYWKSSSDEKEQGVSLYSHTAGAHVTMPDRVVFANWKRINDTAWSFDSSPIRNFNLMPYSINDSAVCQYYAPRTLKAREDWNIQLLFTTEEGEVVMPIAAVPEPKPAPAPVEQAVPRAAIGSTALYGDLLSVNALILEINRLMLQEEVPAQDLQRLRETLAALKSKIAAYTGIE